MTAVVKKIGEKRAGFQVPPVEEVVLYIQEKKGWPEKFAKYYAEKFWCFYQSNGWKVSGRAAMKDWKAAFTSQWQRPKFKEDMEFLNQCLKDTKTLAPVKSITSSTDKLNELLNQYKQNFQSIPDEKLEKVYNYLKENKMIQLSADEKQFIKAAYSNNEQKGKAACVKTMFNNMINYGRTF